MQEKVCWQPDCAGSLNRMAIGGTPFKSQNMALNSFITEEGLEMGSGAGHAGGSGRDQTVRSDESDSV